MQILTLAQPILYTAINDRFCIDLVALAYGSRNLLIITLDIWYDEVKFDALAPLPRSKFVAQVKTNSNTQTNARRTILYSILPEKCECWEQK